MRFGRVRRADWLVGALGVILLASLWTDWYEFPQGGKTAWESFGLLDLVLALVALLAIALPLVTAARESPAVPLAVLVCGISTSFLTLFFVLVRAINEPGDNAEVDFAAGAYVGMLAALAIIAAQGVAMRDESSPGLEPVPEIPARPAPPASA